VGFGPGEGAAQLYKAAIVDRDARQVITGRLERDRYLRAIERQRQHKAPIRFQLFGPGRRDIPSADGENNSIVRSTNGIAKAAVAADHLHTLDARRRKVCACGVHDVLVDVDRHNMTVRADDLRHKRGVVAGAGADLQHSLAWREAELLQHDRHNRRLRG
jgi:hypothetical protein